MRSRFTLQQEQLKEIFSKTKDPQEKYKLIIDLGRALPAMPDEYKTNDHLVSGCQGLLYLYTFIENDTLNFFVESEALISKGLAAILIMAYQGLSLEDMLKSPPNFIQDLDILASISFNRSNGFAHIYQKMRSDALNLLISTTRKHS